MKDAKVWTRPGQAGFPPVPGPFSLGCRCGNLVMTSGRAPVSSAGETVGTGDIGVQAHAVIRNCEAVLKNHGANLSDVVRVTIWLKNLDDYAGMNAVYAQLFADPYPVRSCVQANLIKDDWLVEMEMTALVASAAADEPPSGAP